MARRIIVRKRRSLSGDKDGGIEGLPLQLMIMVIVAGVGTAMILGWMGGIEAPASISSVHCSVDEIVLDDADSDGLYTANDMAFSMTVRDNNGDPLAGATVMLSGSGIGTTSGSAPHTTTDDSGTASFSGLSASRVGSGVGHVTVTVTKAGFGSDYTTSIPVVAA